MITTQNVYTCDNAAACGTAPVTTASMPAGWSTVTQSKAAQNGMAANSATPLLCSTCTAALKTAVPVMA